MTVQERLRFSIKLLLKVLTLIMLTVRLVVLQLQLESISVCWLNASSGWLTKGFLMQDEKFDVHAQERAGSHLITKDLAGVEGPQDLKTGDMTVDEFEDALSKRFAGS